MGTKRSCYQKITKNLNHLKSIDTNETPEQAKPDQPVDH